VRARIAAIGVVAAAAALVVLTSATVAQAAGVAVGYDLSYPQCNQPFPTGGAFAIVGVNGGLPFSVNPCLGNGNGPSELQWAGTAAQFYANTADPGPALSAHWPSGQLTPRECNTPGTPGADTASCAYDYGWNAAADSYQDAVNAYVALGLAPAGSTRTPAPAKWWLDVEAANSWEANTANNVAELQGEVDYLKSVGVAGVGFYSSLSHWQTITGGTTQFATYPFWLAGAASLTDAQARCSSLSNGVTPALVQFPQGSFSADIDCASVPKLAFATGSQRITAGATSAALAVQLSQPASQPLTVTISSSSASGRFATSPAGPWATALSLPVVAGALQTPSFTYRDAALGVATLTASAAGYSSTTQSETVTAAACALPKTHDRTVEVTLGHSRSAAAAALLQRRAAKQVHIRGAKVVVEQDGCTDFEVAVTGLRSRAAALAVVRQLRPAFKPALESN
jgi:hypothetical protein